eukprot:TRINITY_DN12292_c0_g1_i3.p1 TRINITY_DN12292_c0_g1~~TRINITY_DN12292_c0_g1_i3.p1  ORF type:complete len:302 (-),score=33.82 TRINITY_DN12292_c0_g1_i3:25-930(-)
MRLVQFKYKNDQQEKVHLGIELKNGGDIVEIEGTMQEFIEGGDEVFQDFKSQLAADPQGSQFQRIESRQVDLLSPITNPSKILGIGLNYKDGAEEMGKAFPENPIVFLKLPSTISGPDDVLPLPAQSREVDWEVELAVVISKPARKVAEKDAIDYIFGYTVAIDYTARDLIPKNSGLWTLAKNFPGFCCLGPAIVTKDELIPFNLPLSTKVNGVEKQNSSTDKMIFGIRTLISYLSEHMELLPGDVILTGTPAGLGVAKNPPEYIKVGDTIECTVSGIGTLKNTASVDGTGAGFVKNILKR